MPRVRVRRMRPDEGRTYLDIHARSVRGLAAQEYPPEVIDAWAGRVTDDSVRAVERQSDDEIRLLVSPLPLERQSETRSKQPFHHAG